MIPYGSAAALGRGMTWAEAAWSRYSIGGHARLLPQHRHPPGRRRVGRRRSWWCTSLWREDYLGYWIHWLLHTEWGYHKIHGVHHEYAAPMGFAAPYAHWAEVIVLGFPSFAGPAMVPCHMTTFWLWFVIRHIEAIDTHSGFSFPFNPTKLIPFYGGSEYHDYHHYVGRRSQSNFASVFTFCDYICGTDKGYRYHKASLAKLKDLGIQ